VQPQEILQLLANSVQTMYGSGDYLGTAGTQTTFQPITYVGTGGSAVLSGPVTPLWTFTMGTTTYSFELTSLSSAYTGSGSLTLAGSGTAYITGFDATQGSFAIQGTGFQFMSASATANGVGVPDGGSTVALLGFAFLGLEGLRRKLGVL